MGPLFDHLVGEGKQRWRNGNVERHCGPEIYDELDPGRSLDRQVGRLFALENAACVAADLAPPVEWVWPIAHKAADCREVTGLMDRWHFMTCRQRNDLTAWAINNASPLIESPPTRRSTSLVKAPSISLWLLAFRTR